MKILVTRFPLESVYGGAEVQTLSLMEGLARRGHALAFLGSCPVLLEQCHERGLLAAELEIGPPPVSKGAVLRFALRKRKMQATLESAIAEFGSLDAILMLSLSEKLLLTPNALERGMKILWIEHDRVGRWLTKNPWLPILRHMSAQVTTVGVSKLSAQIYRDLGFAPDRVVAIPNGIDLDRFAEVASAEPPALPPGGLLRLLCVARLSPEKGIDVLLRALQEAPNAHLEIVGTGREEGALRSLARSLNIADRVTFTTEHIDVRDAYARSDVLVLPSSEHDPFGLTAAEAMVCGLPAIVTDACGIAGELTSGDGALVVPAGSERALTEAIAQLSDPLQRAAMGRQAQEVARERFSLERMVDAYEQLLRA